MIEGLVPSGWDNELLFDFILYAGKIERNDPHDAMIVIPPFTLVLITNASLLKRTWGISGELDKPFDLILPQGTW